MNNEMKKAMFNECIGEYHRVIKELEKQMEEFYNEYVSYNMDMFKEYIENIKLLEHAIEIKILL